MRGVKVLVKHVLRFQHIAAPAVGHELALVQLHRFVTSLVIQRDLKRGGLLMLAYGKGNSQPTMWQPAFHIGTGL